MSCGISCAANQYLNVANQTCILCSSVIANCNQCYYAGQCITCAAGYTLTTPTQCDTITCPSITNCLACLNNTACAICDYNSSYYVDSSGNCSLCDNSLNFFINMTSPSKQCVNCSQVSCGALCAIGDYLDVPTQTCINCSLAIANCTQCYFAAHCLSC